MPARVWAALMFKSGLGLGSEARFGYVSERWDAGAGGGGEKYIGSGGGLEGAFEYAWGCDCDCDGWWDACVRATEADLRESGRGTLPCNGTYAWFWCA